MTKFLSFWIPLLLLCAGSNILIRAAFPDLDGWPSWIVGAASGYAIAYLLRVCVTLAKLEGVLERLEKEREDA